MVTTYSRATIAICGENPLTAHRSLSVLASSYGPLLCAVGSDSGRDEEGASLSSFSWLDGVIKVRYTCSVVTSVAQLAASIGKFLAAVGFREPPRGGMDQGEALHCGQVRLTLAQDRHCG